MSIPDIRVASPANGAGEDEPDITSPKAGEGEFQPEHAAEAAGEGLAGKLRARHRRRLDATAKEFDIPGWDGDLVVVARPFSDAQALRKGTTNEKFIIGATKRLKYRDDDGEWSEIPGKWGHGLAEMLGVESESQSANVRKVFSQPVDGEFVENPAGVDAFAMRLYAWMTGATDDIEDELGK